MECSSLPQSSRGSDYRVERSEAEWRLDVSKLTYTVCKAIQNPEIEMMNLMAEMSRLTELIDVCKDAIREDQQRIKDAFERGGIPPDEEYPEHIDPEKLYYLTTLR